MDAGEAGESALTAAAATGQAEDVDAPPACGVKKGRPSTIADADSPGRSSPLMRASEEGDARTATKLLESGAAGDAEDADGCTALMRAAEKGDLAEVEALLDSGVEQWEKRTALMLLVKHGSTPMVVKLFNHGADINAEDLYGHSAGEYGHSALSLVMERGVLDELARSLLNHLRRPGDEARLPAPVPLPSHPSSPFLLTPFPARHAQPEAQAKEPEAQAREPEAGGEEMEVDEIEPTVAETATAVVASGGIRSSAAAPDSGTGAASSTMTSPGAPVGGPPPLRRPPWVRERVNGFSCFFSFSAPDDVEDGMFEDYYEPEDSGRGRPPLVHALTESIGPCAHYDEDDLMCELYTVDSVVRVTLIVLSESPEGATHIATVAKQPSFLASVAEKLEVDSAGLHFVEQPSTAGPVRVDAPSPPPLQRLLRGQRSEVEILDATFDFVDLADHALPEHRAAWRASGEAEKMRLAAAEWLAIREQTRAGERAGTVSEERIRAFPVRERARGSGGRLRFAPGDRVRCKIRLQDGSEFAPTGRVTQLRPVGAGQGAARRRAVRVPAGGRRRVHHECSRAAGGQ